VSNWSEPHIALVYFTGLIISLIAAWVLIRIFRSAGIPLKKISNYSPAPWFRTFSTTLIIASLLGAMSVSFRDCHGNYDTLLGSPKETLAKGLDQLSSSARYLHWILLGWLIFFAVLVIVAGRTKEGQSGSR
jgi:hypothetical protein